MTIAATAHTLSEGGTGPSIMLDASGMVTALPRALAVRGVLSPPNASDSVSIPVVPVGELAALLEQARRLQRVIAMLTATQATVWARVLDRVTESDTPTARSSSAVELAVRSIAAEFGAALNLSDHQVQRQLNDAYTLVNRFPATHDALDRGLITAAHARAIVQAGTGISDDMARAAYEEAAVVRAQSTTPWRLKGMLSVLAEQKMPIMLDDRHREARRARCITLTEEGDGMSTLSVLLPTLLAQGAFDRIMGMARTIKHDPEPLDTGTTQNTVQKNNTVQTEVAQAESRTLPQIAVDVLCDLLLGAAPVTTSDAVASIRGRIQVTVPVTTLAGLTDTGAILTGVGPVDAESVRMLASHQPGWDRLMTDAVTGDVLTVDRYTPSSAMRRFLAARDEHCRFPGCRRPVHRCDLDHTLAWEHGGGTSTDNLAHLCRRHHVLKHNSAWKVENLGGGILRWTSPLGHQYVDTPPRRMVAFAPAPVDESAPERRHVRPAGDSAPARTGSAAADPPPPLSAPHFVPF